MQNIDLTERKAQHYRNLLAHIKMGKEILTFGDIKIEKKNFFYHHKSPIFQKRM